MKIARRNALFILITGFAVLISAPSFSQERGDDEKVAAFLESQRGRWSDWNIPEADGRILYDIIVRNNYTKALEIGTSTGHSAVWIAWALSKTGGKLITIEIDEERHKTALENFKKAGLCRYIDARLADAHVLARELEGPFDFIFSDADKGWYKTYFMDLEPKILPGGCFAAHNVSSSHERGIKEFLDHVKGLPGFTTEISDASRSGISMSYKRSEN